MSFLKLIQTTSFLTLTLIAPAGANEWVRNELEMALTDQDMCSAEYISTSNTLSRIHELDLPSDGRALVVNIAAGTITAYEDGHPVIESKAVVGKATTPTPDLDTTLTYVRPNPTWTVPQSIIKRNNWLQKLKSNAKFFEDNQFKVITDDGTLANPMDAAASSVKGFVQSPGPHNSLGALKIAIENDQAIFLHDTNDPTKYDDEIRAASAGCVRVENIRDIAAWILNVETETLDAMIEDGDMAEYEPEDTVRVILGYWTAWPDGDGTIQQWPDIYKRNTLPNECRIRHHDQAALSE